ncbi:YggS family pyridoxal phosphate-dependent enzyme, partial [Candidatus Poribacteria bacterium]|nr:YggS family pyridoxal phosphate-dependent enzyme [Candidatus Poribacteria bacterium]
MTMADFTDDTTRIRKCFGRLKEIKDKLSGFNLTYLSMGMTDDFEIAIEEGSNMIRIGSGIFKT